MIQGENIKLRKLKKSDAQSIFKHANHYEISRYTTLPHPYKLSDAEWFIKFTQKNLREKKAFEFGIVPDGSNEVVGMISLMNVDLGNKKAEIGYWLGKSHWGKKLMKEAILLILKFGFRELKLKRVYAKVMHPNVPSAKLLDRMGFTFEGRMRKSCFRNGKWMDELIYSILDKECK